MLESRGVLPQNGFPYATPRIAHIGETMPENDIKQSVAAMIKRPMLAGVLATATAAIVAAPGPALAESFLKLGDIRGESTDANHKDWIDVLSFTQSWTNSGGTAGGGGGSAGKVQCGAITVMKNIDRASPVLLGAVATGTRIRDGQITFRTEGAQRQEYYTIKLTEVIVTELTQTDTPDPNRIMEKLVINAAKFEYSYRPQNAKGGLGAAVTFSFDCAANKGA
jgi:type VI secretion system secreted protein Hcp